MDNSSVLAQSVATAQNITSSIIVAIIILLVGFGIGVLAKRGLLRLFQEIELNKTVQKIGVSLNVEQGISWLVSIVIYIVTIILFLNRLGVTSIVLWIVLGAVFLLLITTFVVGIRDLIPNLIAWFMITRKKKLHPGKRITVREVSGVIERIGYLETEIKTDQGDILYVPNSLFLRSKHKITV